MGVAAGSRRSPLRSTDESGRGRTRGGVGWWWRWRSSGELRLCWGRSWRGLGASAGASADSGASRNDWLPLGELATWRVLPYGPLGHSVPTGEVEAARRRARQSRQSSGGHQHACIRTCGDLAQWWDGAAGRAVYLQSVQHPAIAVQARGPAPLKHADGAVACWGLGGVHARASLREGDCGSSPGGRKR